MSTLIRFDRVSKKFMLYHQRTRSLQELMVNILKGKKKEDQEIFWSLRDVSFEVGPGETVGIIGSNGAGKSTVLKLIARIIRPTSGQIEINGRVSALLELGSGFHPDMTGRENIYLNGSILGLSQAEIRRKLDEIIAFAELERFIDLPVKHYSSGMYVRLGFAVAVHTEPHVLLVDEVLAVGDAAFQRKCLDHIDYLRQQGVTILLVSHSLTVVQQICKRAIWINEGGVIADGPTETVNKKYAWHSHKNNPINLVEVENAKRWGNGKIEIKQVCLLDKEDIERSAFRTHEPLTIQMHYQAKQRIERPVFGFAIHRGDGTHISGPNSRFGKYEIPWVEGKGVIEYKVASLPLLEGSYYLSVIVCDWEMTMSDVFDYHDQLYPFRVHTDGGPERYGVLALNGVWQNGRQDDEVTTVEKREIVSRI